MRTLVVSDFHLGARLQRAVLLRAEPLEALLGALENVERLVLLGDVVELLEGRPAQALAAAEPVLRALGSRLGADAEVVLVPGNHDGALVRPFLREHGLSPAVDAALPLDATPALARIAAWLEPAQVRVHYPGVWLADRVWATHGHYLDRHLVPGVAYGVARGLLGRAPRDEATPSDYERRREVSLSRLEALLTRWLPRPLAALVDDTAELLRAASMAGMPRLLLGRRIAPLSATVLGAQMRRASIPALARVTHRLGVDADSVIFGHVHRLGPVAGDDPASWRGPGGRPSIVNSGSWVYEPLLLHRARAPHPYWPGGAVLVEAGAAPRPIGLLDHLDAGALHQ